jgi:hypothetical protein
MGLDRSKRFERLASGHRREGAEADTEAKEVANEGELMALAHCFDIGGRQPVVLAVVLAAVGGLLVAPLGSLLLIVGLWVWMHPRKQAEATERAPDGDSPTNQG